MPEESPKTPTTPEVNPPPTEEQQTTVPTPAGIIVQVAQALAGGYAAFFEWGGKTQLLRAADQPEPVLAAVAELITGRAVKTLLVEFADEESDGPHP